MRQLDIYKIADEAKLNSFHGLVLFWCSLIIIFDGYDLAVAGIAMPAIMKDMGVNSTQAGFMASSALFGMMFGAIFLGTLADRVGRRWVIAICIVLFSIFTAAAGLTQDPVVFGVMRFLAGLGIGGVMPNIVAEMTEYAPRRMRATLVTLMFSGYSVGGMLAAFLGKAMLESFGWQSVFYAALAPIVLVPFIFMSLPESMSFLHQAGRFSELKAIIARLDRTYSPSATDHFVLPERNCSDKAPVHHLFSERRSFSTIMLWLASFMCLFMVYALSTWLTKLMASAGYNLGSAMTFVMVLNLGAMIGAVGGGWLADRFNIKYVLIFMYLLAALSITLLGRPLPLELLFVVVGLAGASTIGTQIVNNAFVGQFYPAAVRSTGLGWALGVGRGGAIIAPILIGVLVGMSLPLEMNFVAIAIPGLFAAIAISMVNSKLSAAGSNSPISSEVSSVQDDAIMEKGSA
ncbi:MFS transporter [Azotobacter beijerinckii]|uniref:MFS transporter n=1 Tax=Azotobacter beijerinckii TaxID=170623 RepID=UPI0029534F3F|nr:MFS transporter [Azotobacter beijerinckii]MDV7212602.1 MFS transporter [Azotobacter beijerinckii]